MFKLLICIRFPALILQKPYLIIPSTCVLLFVTLWTSHNHYLHLNSEVSLNFSQFIWYSFQSRLGNDNEIERFRQTQSAIFLYIYADYRQVQMLLYDIVNLYKTEYTHRCFVCFAFCILCTWFGFKIFLLCTNVI